MHTSAWHIPRHRKDQYISDAFRDSVQYGTAGGEEVHWLLAGPLPAVD